MEHRNVETIRAELSAVEREQYITEMDEPREPYCMLSIGSEDEPWTTQDFAAYDAYVAARNAFWDHQNSLRQRIYNLRIELEAAIRNEEERREKNRRARERAKKRRAAAKTGIVPVGMVYAN